MKEEIIVEPVAAPRAGTPRRISWAAIFGGLIITLAVQLLLAVLGISIGATVSSQGGQSAFGENAGLAAGAWLIIISIISLFFGGWVSGRMSGTGRNSEGALHGLVTWGAATLLTVCLLTGAAGGVLSGMGKLWAQILPMNNSMLAGNQESQSGMNMEMNHANNQVSATVKNDWSSIKQEARDLAQKNGATPTGRVTGTPDQSQGTSAQLVSALDRMFSHGGNINPNDREAVVNLLMTQDNMSQAQANQTVDRWIQTYKQSRNEPAQNNGQGYGNVAQTILASTWGTFIALVLGLLAAMWGGSLGMAAYLRTRGTVEVVKAA